MLAPEGKGAKRYGKLEHVLDCLVSQCKARSTAMLRPLLRETLCLFEQLKNIFHRRCLAHRRTVETPALLGQVITLRLPRGLILVAKWPVVSPARPLTLLRAEEHRLTATALQQAMVTGVQGRQVLPLQPHLLLHTLVDYCN